MARFTLGLAATSYLSAWQTIDTLEFINRCHNFGVAGAHAVINSDPQKIRSLTESYGMYFEAMVPLPVNGDTAEFEHSLKAAQSAGATALRAACLGTRRYETFHTVQAWNEHVSACHKSLEAALPLLAKYKIPLGLENHKDWTSDELLALITRYSSEYFGVCLDFGNNLSLMEAPLDTIAKLAPFAVTTHLKDVAVAPYQDGILLSEVVLGNGIIPLNQAVSLIRQHRPNIHLNLEMITRQPLQIPMRTAAYQTTFDQAALASLDTTISLAERHQAAFTLTHAEDQNILDCLAAWDRMSL